MQIHQRIKDTISQHKNKIELFQWSVMAGISSLIYSEYISQFTQKQFPVRRIFVPSISNVRKVLEPEGQLMQLFSDKLIDEMTSHKLFQQYIDAPEFILFHEDNVEVLKTILDLYIIPNVYRIPETISIKFRLGDESNQLFYESKEADLFQRQPISDDQFHFLVEEIVLQLLFLIPSMKKDIEIPEKNTKIFLTENEVITIDNASAAGPIHFSDNVIQNSSVIELLKFVTSTTILQTNGETAAQKHDDVVKYIISTNVFNEVVITRFQGIENQV